LSSVDNFKQTLVPYFEFITLVLQKLREPFLSLFSDFSQSISRVIAALGSGISWDTGTVAGGQVQQFEAISREGMIRRILLLDALVQMHPSTV